MGDGCCGCVLVPLDGTEGARSALPVGAALAEALGSVLHVVHVTEGEPRSARELARGLGLSPRAAEHLVVEALAGPPGQAIWCAAERLGARLITLCTHTVAGAPSDKLGHVAREVLERAPCPVVLVRPERGAASFTPRRLLLPHDGTPTSAAAAPFATELAQATGATLHVLHIATAAKRQERERGTLAAPRYLDQPQHEWPAWSREFLERLGSGVSLPTGVNLHLAHGAPEEEVLHFAEAQAMDLILVSWRGRFEGDRARVVKAALFSGLAPVLVLRVEGAVDEESRPPEGARAPRGEGHWEPHASRGMGS